ncbi:hypothetical protein [Roseibacillus ishigakijimensis]|uniref:Uncharacterized protein n=1 Tax=Roseibacillus ishigakijimensis TaxID=454146 RepID=A0A934RRD2_9BACT|nr:hypothetical protein [Roseibacillus ishigakijimensis]MBK1832860.1 hypothetical protein [Roseibacillus ishigakijimensis]
MFANQPINLHFTIPATDALGREEVEGQLRFHAENLDLHWRLKGNVFTGGAGEMTTIAIPYPAVAEVRLHKRWFRPSELILRVEDPSLVAAIPGSEVGRLVMQVQDQSKDALKNVNELIDYRRSVFLLDETNKRLEVLRES